MLKKQSNAFGGVTLFPAKPLDRKNCILALQVCFLGGFPFGFYRFLVGQTVVGPNVSLLGLRPLASCAFLKFYHVMSIFYEDVTWLVRLCVLLTPTPDDAGDASLLGPSQKVHMGSRARAPEAPERAAQKAQPASQPGKSNATKRRK